MFRAGRRRFAMHCGNINIRPIKEVVSVEVAWAWAYRGARDIHRASLLRGHHGGRRSMSAGQLRSGE